MKLSGGNDLRVQGRCGSRKVMVVMRMCSLRDGPSPINEKRFCGNRDNGCISILSTYNPGEYCSLCIQKMERRSD